MLTRAQMNEDWNRCESLYERGEWGTALKGYQKLLGELAISIVVGEYEPDEVFLFLVGRVADLSVPFGRYEEADNLLEKVSELFASRLNDYFADFIALKRIRLAWMQDEPERMAAGLRLLTPRIGDFETIDDSQAGLRQWEQSCRWRKSDNQGRHVLMALLCLEIGGYNASRGKYNRASRFFEHGVPHTEGNAPPLAREAGIPLRIGLATAQLEKGELKAARQSVLALQKTLNPAQHPAYVVQLLGRLAKLDLSEGRFGSAEERLLETLTLCDERGFVHASIIARLNLAHVKIYLNQTFLAREWLSEIQRAAERTKDQAIKERAEWLLNLANWRSRPTEGNHSVEMLARMMERRNGQIAAADGRELAADKQSAIKQPTVKQPCSYLAYFEAHALRFYALLRCNQIGELRQMLDAMEEKFAPTESEWIRARLYLLRGIVNYYEGRDQALAERSLSSEIRFRQAEEHLAQAAARFEMLGVKPEVWQAQRVLLWCQKHLSKDPAAIAELRDQAGDLLDELVQSLPPAERAFLVVDNLTADEEALVDKVARIEELRQVLSELPGSRWMTVPRKFPLRVAMARLIHELLLDIDRQKGALSRRVIEGRDKTPDDAPPLTFWQRLWQHPRGRATLSFLVLPDFTVAIRSGFLMLQLSVSQIKRSEVRDFVRGWHLNADPQKGRQLMGLTGQRNLRPVMVHQAEERLKRESQVREFDFNEIATVIAHALSLPHLLQDLPPGTALTIVPDDSLHGFPFAATRINGRSLIEAFPISLAFESKLRAAALAPPALQQTLLVAVPHGWENPLIKGERYDPLPGTLDELARVNEWFKRKPKACAQRLGSNDKRVGKKELLHQLSTSTFFHIACHGQSDPDSPDQSGLVLMPEEGRMEVFTLRELSALTLGGLRHATLSSCWSADNFVLPGRWVISLPETLWRAGAHSILGSLWEVSDEIAIAFMHRFYQYLEKHPRDLALRQTQLDCKNGTLLPGNEETVKPENWAGYNLYGDYRVLRFDDGDERQGIWQRLLDRLIQREK